MTDYRKLTPQQLDAAIMYQVTYGRDLQKLEHLLRARNYKEGRQEPLFDPLSGCHR